MPSYLTPGVYYERADVGDASIAPLRTDVAGFVGIARRGPLDRALPVDSWRQFVATFGGFSAQGYLAYAVRAFFENGGRRCWVARVASPAAATAGLFVDDTRVVLPPERPHALRVEAASPGVWGNDLELEWRETQRAQTTADPVRSAPEYLTVGSVAGFERGTHVRAFVGGAGPEYRVVAAVDPDLQRLYLVHPRPALRHPLERPLTSYDANKPLVLESIEYSLLVYELGRLAAVIERLSLSPLHARYAPRFLAPPGARTDRKAHRRPDAARTDRLVDETPYPVVVVECRDGAALALGQPLAAGELRRRSLGGGLDGLSALTVRDFLGEPGTPFDDHDTRRRKGRGLRMLEEVSEVAIVAVPDINIQPVLPPPKAPLTPCDPGCFAAPTTPAPPHAPSEGDLPPAFTPEQVFEVDQALVEHCRLLGDRFALVDPPFHAATDPRVGVGPLRAFRRRFDASVAALYAPWLFAPDPLGIHPSGLRPIPPSGHVAGFMAQTDHRSGVHRAPANGVLGWVQGTTMPIDDVLHGVLNADHVNAIRTFPGRGLRIFGARTLSSDSSFRFVNVRRLVLMLKKAIRVGLQWATFEPNDRLTRTKLHLALTSLLLEVWRCGALAGATAQEAFHVDCEVSSARERDQGMLVAKVLIAPAHPFEFVVLRVGVSDNALEIHESDDVEWAS